MKILQRYIGFSILTAFVVVLLVMLGVLCLGNLIRIADLVIRGVDALLLFRFLFFLNVRLLQYAIPMALVTATLLVFGRLSADNEITAMRASGIGLKSISLPVILLAAALSIFSVYLNNTVIPESTFSGRRIKDELSLIDPKVLLEPGKFVVFPGYAISIQRKRGDILENLWVYSYHRGKLASAVVASRAEIEPAENNYGFTLVLYHGTMEEYDAGVSPLPTQTVFEKLRYPIDLSEMTSQGDAVAKRADEMTRSELIRYRRELAGQDSKPYSLLSRVSTEIHTRLALALGCFSIVLISIPLALKTHRSEKSIAMSLSLVLISVFYAFVLLSRALDDSPGHYPHLIVWIPNLLFGTAGLIWMAKFSRI
jgi:lipopolysaccharide export system permease protein